MLSDSSSITAPSLLYKHTRSKGPFPPPALPGLIGLRPSPTPRLAAALSGDVLGPRPPANPEPPSLTQTTFPMRAQYPGGPGRYRWLTVARSRARVSSLSVLPSPLSWRVRVHITTFEACSSVTRVTACRVAHPSWAKDNSFLLTVRRLDSLAAVILNMLLECFDGGAPIAPSWSTVPGLRGGHGLGSFNHGPFKHKAFGADTAIVHSLEPPAPFSLDPRTKTILCEQEEHEQDSMLLF